MTSHSKNSRQIMLTSVLAVSAVTISAQAGQPEYDALGLRSNPICTDKVDADDYFVEVKGRKPTGLKAETDKWSLELYENKNDRSWVILATNTHAPKNEDKVCVLAVGEGPYQHHEWYIHLLAKKPAAR